MLKSNSIGNKITEARKKINISQSQLAERMFISPQAVGKWERGESMPDILTFNRLAEILGVDLNYFSENFATSNAEALSANVIADQLPETSNNITAKKLNWDLSHENMMDTDFSGLKNLHEKFSSSNMQRCLFIGSDLSNLLIKGNNIEACNFNGSNLQGSKVHNSNLSKNDFTNCNLKGAGFLKSFVEGCDFSGADFSDAVLNSGGFGSNTISNVVWDHTSFKAMHLADLLVEGKLENCFFETCAFTNVEFRNATLINTFFKHNKKLKRVKFIDCKVDKITYAFLKTGDANLSAVTIID